MAQGTPTYQAGMTLGTTRSLTPKLPEFPQQAQTPTNPPVTSGQLYPRGIK